MTFLIARDRPDRTELFAWATVLLTGGVLSWASATHPATIPAWAPWDFSWPIFGALAAALWWYARGLTRTPAAARPAGWRQACFLAGMLLLYTVLQTRFVYLSQHMFFLNRLQHLAMHHLGPFLIALAWPGATIRRGMPAWVRGIIDSRAMRRTMWVVQQPLIAAALFVGLIALWLEPDIHFAAMIDPRLYAVMNASMVIDGLFFWCLVLDPRPAPPARTGYAVRMAIVVGVMFPQILMGSTIAFTQQVLYSYYDLCGRLYPSVNATLDQHLGGLVVWIPAAMMSVIGFFVVLVHFRLHEEAMADQLPDPGETGGIVLRASAWTGR